MEHGNTPIIQKKRPDWKNIKEYDYLKDASHEQFAWEFLRRNESYQKDYKKYWKFPSRKALESNKDNKNFFYKYYDSDPPVRRKESYNAYSARVLKSGKMLPSGGICLYEEKRGNFIEKYDLERHDDMSMYSPRNQNSPGFYCLNEEYPVFTTVRKKTLTEDFEDEMVFKISLLLPIDEQIAKITAAAVIKSKNIIKIEKNSIEHKVDVLIRYLRLLDANDKKATVDEILFYLYIPEMGIEYYKPNNPEEVRGILSNLEDNKADFLITRLDSVELNYRKNLREAKKLYQGGFVSIIQSVSHHLNKALNAEEQRILKEI